MRANAGLTGGEEIFNRRCTQMHADKVSAVGARLTIIGDVPGF
jgi:hypothetical protein